jgi:hypothetical protein
MGKVTFRNARLGETLFGGGCGILIPFRPIETVNRAQPSEPEIEEESSSDRGYYTDIGEIEGTIQDFVDSEEEHLGRPLTKKEHQAIVKFCTPEEQDDYEEE